MASFGKHAMIYTMARKLAVRADVLGLLVGRLIQNHLLREPRRKQIKHIRHADFAHAPI